MALANFLRTAAVRSAHPAVTMRFVDLILHKPESSTVQIREDLGKSV